MQPFLKKFWPFLLLAVLAFTIHLAFLSHPSQVVFDEVHFGKFVGDYFTGKYYFDIHPPLGKLMIAAWAKINGVNPNFDFDHIGENIPQNILFTLRFLPAFFGGLFVLAFAWLAYLVSRSKIAAFCAGFLILLDNAFLVQSKFILVDIFLVFFGLLAFCFFFLYQRQKTYSAKWFLFLILTGVSFGLSVSIKWTGLATVGIFATILFAKVFSKKLSDYLSPHQEIPLFGQRIKEFLIGFFILLIVGFLIYALPFIVHLKLLPKPGPGDAFMSQKFQQELQLGRENVSQPLTFWQKFFELNKVMYTANAGLTTSHPFGSRWYTWPFNHKPIYYWTESPPENQNNPVKIYFLGNHLLWWLAAVSVIFTLICALNKKRQKNLEPIFFILLLGWLANLLPFIFIKRVSFLYHYLPAVTFAILISALWLAKLWPKQKTILLTILGIVVIGFLLLAPLSYGWPLPAAFDKFEMRLINFF